MIARHSGSPLFLAWMGGTLHHRVWSLDSAQRMALARRVAERYERSIVPLRQKIVGLTQAEYNAMIVGVPDLLAAKSAETRVGIEQARAVQDYWTARADLERAIGVKLPDLPAPTAPPPPQEPAPDSPPDSMPDSMPDMPGMRKPESQPSESTHQQHQPR